MGRKKKKIEVENEAIMPDARDEGFDKAPAPTEVDDSDFLGDEGDDDFNS